MPLPHPSREREQPPRFAHPGSFEFEYSQRWKSLDEMEKQQRQQVEKNIREAREKLESEMEDAYHEHQANMLRQGELPAQHAALHMPPAPLPELPLTSWTSLSPDLLRRQEELRRMEELHSQEMQKRKEMQLRYMCALPPDLSARSAPQSFRARCGCCRGSSCH